VRRRTPRSPRPAAHVVDALARCPGSSELQAAWKQSLATAPAADARQESHPRRGLWPRTTPHGKPAGGIGRPSSSRGHGPRFQDHDGSLGRPQRSWPVRRPVVVRRSVPHRPRFGRHNPSRPPLMRHTARCARPDQADEPARRKTRSSLAIIGHGGPFLASPAPNPRGPPSMSTGRLAATSITGVKAVP
jgi:hypothetical protein